MINNLSNGIKLNKHMINIVKDYLLPNKSKEDKNKYLEELITNKSSIYLSLTSFYDRDLKGVCIFKSSNYWYLIEKM